MKLEFAVIAGLFSLAGVIIGALVTTGTQLYLEKKRENRETQRAARLIDSDLMFAEVAAESCINNKKWWVKSQRLTTDGWQQYRDIIVSKLSWSDWVAVMVAIQAVNQLQEARDAYLNIQLAEMTMDSKMDNIVASAKRHNLDIVHPAPAIPVDIIATQIKPKLVHISGGRTALASLTHNR